MQVRFKTPKAHTFFPFLFFLFLCLFEGSYESFRVASDTVSRVEAADSDCCDFKHKTVETRRVETCYRNGKGTEPPVQPGLEMEVIRFAGVPETSLQTTWFPAKHGQSCVHAAAVVTQPLGTVTHVCVYVDFYKYGKTFQFTGD